MKYLRPVILAIVVALLVSVAAVTMAAPPVVTPCTWNPSSQSTIYQLTGTHHDTDAPYLSLDASCLFGTTNLNIEIRLGSDQAITVRRAIRHFLTGD